MPMSHHVLHACTPTPLASYLKALGVLRLVAEQADPEARGWWRDDTFHLLTSLDRAGLLDFLANRYAPSPIVSPWNGGSGFYPNDKSAREKGIEPLLASTHPRFAPYRRQLKLTIEATSELDAKPTGDDKLRLQAYAKATWDGAALGWLRSAVALNSEGASYPALLGTGGNDGRLDFSSNFMQRVAEAFDLEGGGATDGLGPLRAALFDEPWRATTHTAIGQFLPGAAGGANADNSPSAQARVNVWEFLLLFEGALTLQVAAVRTLDGQLPKASAPFAFHAQAAGYATATRSEESTRGEQWMPLWSHPSSLTEVRALFREGRMQVDRRPARTATDAARAIASRAVSRGVDGFERYAFIERQGLSNLAVPIGRWTVHDAGPTHLLQGIAPWAHSLRMASRDPQRDPESLRRIVLSLETDVLELHRRGGRGADWRQLLARLGEAEHQLTQRPRHTADRRLRPLPGLSAEWITLAAGDAAPAELRLAGSLALREGSRSWTMLRRYCMPLKSAGRFDVAQDALRRDPDVVWTGRDLASDLTAVLQRQLLAGHGPAGGEESWRVGAGLSDLQDFVDGRIDDQLTSHLMRALMAVTPPRDGSAFAETRRLRQLLAAPIDRALDPVVGVFLLGAHLSQLPDHAPIGMRDVVRVLRSGRADAAFRLLRPRLRAAGLTTTFTSVLTSPARARRIAAALIFPLSTRTLFTLVRALVHAPDDVLETS